MARKSGSRPFRARAGVLVWQRRLDHALTQAALAERVGVSRKTINTVENSVFVPSVLLALGIAEALDSSVDALFFLEQAPGAP